MSVFTLDGAVPIDNNISERDVKRIVLNRKNSLFVGNERGGQTAAILTDHLLDDGLSCKMQQLIPIIAVFVEAVQDRLPTKHILRRFLLLAKTNENFASVKYRDVEHLTKMWNDSIQADGSIPFWMRRPPTELRRLPENYDIWRESARYHRSVIYWDLQLKATLGRASTLDELATRMHLKQDILVVSREISDSVRTWRIQSI